ncbi:unnamed protein product [Prunus armeniaca]
MKQFMNGTTFRGQAMFTGSASASSSSDTRTAASSFGPLGLFGKGVTSRAPLITLFPVTWRWASRINSVSKDRFSSSEGPVTRASSSSLRSLPSHQPLHKTKGS